jgi:hypothetical protein
MKSGALRDRLSSKLEIVEVKRVKSYKRKGRDLKEVSPLFQM